MEEFRVLTLFVAALIGGGASTVRGYSIKGYINVYVSPAIGILVLALAVLPVFFVPMPIGELAIRVLIVVVELLDMKLSHDYYKSSSRKQMRGL